ncbi:NACHT domain protein [Aspergillus sclerotialis]|uniref:NACHT domain protein n=1 Tax=Aspergillus sclerotialis TaxID=2070753 RepID=A0A3A2ZJD2_9EURO|nr:NACHT domain protein [Aspergillus sclerotialis]
MSDSDQDFVVVDQPDISPKIAELTSWLQPTDYQAEYSDFKKHLSSHVPGTGEWLEKTPEYQEWHDSETHGSLWLKAVAGAGKSVLAARLISHLRATEPNVPVLFFFFRQIIASNHDPHSLVRDWMAQLLGYSPHLRMKLDGLIQDDRVTKDMAFSELWQILIGAFRLLDKVYCVVDALDELDSEHTVGFLQRLVALGELRPNAVKLLMTSRPLPQVQKVLNVSSIAQVRLEDRQVNKDIGIFVQHRLAQAVHLSETARETIRRSIEDRVHPSFLYARLVLNELLDEHRGDSLEVATVQNALVTLPSSMEDMYSEMLYDHSQLASVPQERQLLILQLATHASRPLRLLEIATVVDFLDMNKGATKHGDTKDLTRISCGPLLEILDDETVSIIHHSFTEFLTDTSRKTRSGMEHVAHRFPVIESPKTHELMGLLCVKYLLSGCLSSWNFERKKSRYFEEPVTDHQKQLQLQHPFLNYALENWYYHVRRVPELKGRLLEELNAYMDSENISFHAWIDAIVRPASTVESLSPLHAAAWAGISTYVKHLLATGSDINALTSEEETPLTLAAQRGNADIVTILLDHGAAPNEPDKLGHKPLHFAARSNHYKTVQLLLKAGVSPLTGKTRENPGLRCGNAWRTVGDTPLRYASKAGCLESVQAMLPYLGKEDIHSAFKWSVGRGHQGLVEFLLKEAGVDASAKIGGNCLIEAASKLNWDMMQLLIQNGADPAYRPTPLEEMTIHEGLVSIVSQKQQYVSLLHAVCASREAACIRYSDREYQNFEKCITLALDAGCDVNFKSGRVYTNTALHYCVNTGASVVQKLLQYGADVHATDYEGNTPLHLLVPSAETAAILETLMRHGARCDVIREKDGKTPLHTWCSSFSFKVDIQCLRPYIKDWNVPDSNGNTPLHLCASDSKDACKQLIDMGADVNRQNHEGQTPLHQVDRFSTWCAAEDFLAAGADIEARDNKGRTWFLIMALKESYSPREHLPKLLDLGANLHATDYEGNGALHLVCQTHQSENSVKFLLEVGADPKHVNFNGDTVYHALMRYCFESAHRYFQPVLDLLLATDAPTTAKNYQGENLLHSVCKAGISNVNSALRSSTHNPMNSFSQTDIDVMIKDRDNEGRLPIHAAATSSDELVAWCISKGSDITALTYKWQNLLHVAASADQSNALGLLLETYTSTDQTEVVINQRDEDGRTPLHYACAVGRTESVQLLLQAGADVTIADKKDWTPLHMCAKFTRKHASSREGSRRPDQAGIISEKETLRITDIIHLLARHGADLNYQPEYGPTPMKLAIDYCSEEMVIALLQAASERSIDVGLGCDQPTVRYLASKGSCAGEIADQIRFNPNRKEMLNSCAQLLRLGGYRVLESLAERGFEFTAERQDNTDDFLVLLARWGFTDLFEKLGKCRENTAWINGSFTTEFRYHGNMRPLLMHIAARELPSIDLLRLAIETFNADVNVKVTREGYQMDSDVSVLHILARGSRWWHTEAIRYVLSRGADVTVVDEGGHTPLHVAVSGGYRRLGIVQALLEHGANPNTLDEEGKTPLNHVRRDPDMVRLLIRHGADVTLGDNPVLFEAIDGQDVDTVQAILDTGIGCNKPFKDGPAPEPGEDEGRMYFFEILSKAERNERLRYRPIRLATTYMFDNAEKQQKVETIVRMLLDHGADPFQSHDDTTTVLHDLLDQGGTTDPLLSLPGLDLETRDGRGRTLLLAACGSQACGTHYESLGKSHSELISKLYDMGADVSAADNNGNNVLHSLIDAIRKNKSEKDLMSMVPLFIDKCPALLHQANNEGYKPIQLAAEKHHWKMMHMLLEVGANPLEPDPNGNTILHHMAGKFNDIKGDKHKRRLNEALDLGLDINARNNDGDTPLSKYILSLGKSLSTYYYEPVSETAIEALQDARADFFTRNNAGENLLHLVARLPISELDLDIKGDAGCDLFKLLMDMGLDPFLEDYRQRTPVDVAAAYGRNRILELFQKK